MAIEDKIDALIAALDRNTAAHGGKASTAAGKAADAAIEKEATRAAAATAKKTAASKLTLDGVKEKFLAYLGTEDKKEKAKRATQIKAITDHFGVGKIGEIDEENWKEALGYLKAFEDGETPSFMEENDEGEGDDALV